MVCGKRERGSGVIIANSEHSLGRVRYTIAHELCHLYYHEEFSAGCYLGDQKDIKEVEADMFASHFLMPDIALRWYFGDVLHRDPRREEVCLQDVIRIQHYFGFSRMAILWRLFNDGYISENQRVSYGSSPTDTALYYMESVELYRRPRRQRDAGVNMFIWH